MDYEEVNYIIKSEIRFYILISLKNQKQSPSSLSKNSKFHLSHISKNLKELVELEYIICEKCYSNKNKTFKISKKGKDFLKFINKLTYLPES